MPPTMTPEQPAPDQVLHLLHQLTEKVTGHIPLDKLLDFVFENFQNVVPYSLHLIRVSLEN